jgi:hypothetical protein
MFPNRAVVRSSPVVSPTVRVPLLVAEYTVPAPVAGSKPVSHGPPLEPPAMSQVLVEVPDEPSGVAGTSHLLDESACVALSSCDADIPPVTMDLLERFAQVSDPRCAQRVTHPVAVVLALCAGAVVAGMRSFTAIAGWVSDTPADLLVSVYARCGPASIRPVPPSKATIWRVLTEVDAAAVDAAIGAWPADRAHASVRGETVEPHHIRPCRQQPCRYRGNGDRPRPLRPVDSRLHEERVGHGHGVRNIAPRPVTGVTLRVGPQVNSPKRVSSHDQTAFTPGTGESA